LGLGSVVFTTHTPLLHWFGWVARPGREHEPPPVHSLSSVHAVPATSPPMQRVPPHVTPLGQSASVLHASAAAVAQVSQKHWN